MKREWSEVEVCGVEVKRVEEREWERSRGEWEEIVVACGGERVTRDVVEG